MRFSSTKLNDDTPVVHPKEFSRWVARSELKRKVESFPYVEILTRRVTVRMR